MFFFLFWSPAKLSASTLHTALTASSVGRYFSVPTHVLDIRYGAYGRRYVVDVSLFVVRPGVPGTKQITSRVR